MSWEDELSELKQRGELAEKMGVIIDLIVTIKLLLIRTKIRIN